MRPTCIRQLLLLSLCVVVGCSVSPARNVLPVPATVDQPPARFPQPRKPFSAPDKDPFHAQPGAAELAATPSGTVMRYRPIAAKSYYFFHVNAQAWQVLYRTTDTFGRPQADVATIMVPDDAKPQLLSYQTAYDALTRRCAPSYEILSGSMVEQLLVNRALRRGWVVVLPDYEGPEAQFFAGINSGRGVLDGIRAAQAFLPNTLADADMPVALWGYSGGAFASLWAAELAASYAPRIALAGVAAGGSPANLTSTARHIDGGLFAGLYFVAVIGLSRAYDGIDTDTLFNAKGHEMFADLGASCIGQELAGVKGPLLTHYTFDKMREFTTVDDLLNVPAVQRVIDENRPGQRGFDAPLFYYQAFFDELTPRRDAKALARRYCDQGISVRFDYAFGEHVSAALTHASDAVDYLADRFAGTAPPSDCDAL